METNIYLKAKEENDRLRAIIKKQQEILSSFGYPENKPQPVSNAKHWKDKYKKLMDKKINLERDRNKLFVCAEKLVKLLMDNNIPINIKDMPVFIGPTGVPLIPGTGQDSTLEYKPFNNKF